MGILLKIMCNIVISEVSDLHIRADEGGLNELKLSRKKNTPINTCL